MSYYDNVLSSPAICSCCFGLKEIETDGGETLAYHPTSTIEYVPASRSSASKTQFCDCGVDGAFERTWTTATTRKQFREQLKQLVKSLDRRGFDVDAKSFFKAALFEWRRSDTDQDVDAALAAGSRKGVD